MSPPVRLHEGLLPVPPMGTPVQASRADFRVNLTVTASDRPACMSAGGKYDDVNKVMYAPPRINLRPLAAWLPFDLDSIEADPKTGLIMDSPGMPKAPGPIKQDGSPNMAYTVNKRLRDSLSTPEEPSHGKQPFAIGAIYPVPRARRIAAKRAAATRD